MASKNNPRNWNDVQAAIATVAIVTTLGMWNLFATPKPQQSAKVDQTVPPTQPPADLAPTPMPQVKIFFTTQAAPHPVTSQQPRTTEKKKKKNNGGGGTVTRTKSS